MRIVVKTQSSSSSEAQQAAENAAAIYIWNTEVEKDEG